jgi:hypothetical protein
LHPRVEAPDGSSGDLGGIMGRIASAAAREGTLAFFVREKGQVARVDLLLNPEVWVAFLTLLALEIVLGIDNIVFISILVDKLPQQRQALARRLGLGMALHRLVALARLTKWCLESKPRCPWGGIKGKETGTGPDDAHYLRARLQVRNRSARAR